MADILVAIGVVLMVVAAVGAVVAGVLFIFSGKRLRVRLEREFGKKRH